jgi:hypothetical protein
MSSKTPFAILFGGADRSALDLPVAGLAGLAVAFAMFTIPDDLLAQAVGATGIANLIAAAQPPLGTTARIVLASAGAITAFFGAFLLLRWLDRFALRSPSAALEVIETEAPRIRKSDAHPDAPPCRPISASRDLGEPAPPSRPIPTRRDPAAPEPQPEAPIVAAEPSRPAVRSAPAEPSAPARPSVAAIPEARPAPSPVKASSPAAPAASQTLSDLMARLEHGLARREKAAPVTAAAAPPAHAAAPPPAPPASAPRPAAERPAAPPPTPSNDRLQNAIDGLRALSVRV